MFAITIRDGHVLTTCRKPEAAKRLLASFVAGKVENLREHAKDGERVVTGSAKAKGNEVAVEAVAILKNEGGESITYFAIERVNHV